MLRCPGDPVDGLASDDLQVRIDAHPIQKQAQVVAAQYALVQRRFMRRVCQPLVMTAPSRQLSIL